MGRPIFTESDSLPEDGPVVSAMRFLISDRERSYEVIEKGDDGQLEALCSMTLCKNSVGETHLFLLGIPKAKYHRRCNATTSAFPIVSSTGQISDSDGPTL